MKLRKKKVNYQDGGRGPTAKSGPGVIQGAGKRHDRLRRRGHKLRSRAEDQPVSEKGEKKYAKLQKRAQKKLDKAKEIRAKQLAERERVAQGKANIDAAVKKALKQNN
jgi:hypothetical protein